MYPRVDVFVLEPGLEAAVLMPGRKESLHVKMMRYLVPENKVSTLVPGFEADVRKPGLEAWGLMQQPEIVDLAPGLEVGLLKLVQAVWVCHPCLGPGP